jgi:hypothetical protein
MSGEAAADPNYTQHQHYLNQLLYNQSTFSNQQNPLEIADFQLAQI